MEEGRGAANVNKVPGHGGGPPCAQSTPGRASLHLQPRDFLLPSDSYLIRNVTLRWSLVVPN